MSILVTGSTGSIGSHLLRHLANQDIDVRALTRSIDKARFPGGVTPVQGDFADIDSMRAALQGVSTAFILVPTGADELTQAMQVVNLARDAGVKGIVYLSVFRGDVYADVPHFVSKFAVEQQIARCAVAATILRPSYFMQNDVRLEDGLLTRGSYEMPIGSRGISMVDTRDVAEAAARELLRRERAAMPLPSTTVAMVGADVMHGAALAEVWTAVLGRTVAPGSEDLDALEQQLRAFSPAWLAYDLKLMFRAYQTAGAAATPDEVRQTIDVLGREPRRYRAFAEETARLWAARHSVSATPSQGTAG